MSTRGNKTRELICKEAYRLFADKGFKEVTMTDICERTGLSRGGLYRHYSSTEQIFEQIIDSLMHNQQDEIHSKIEAGLPARVILLDILERYRQEMLDYESSLSVALYEFFSRKQYLSDENALYRQYLLSKKMWEALLEYGIQSKEFRAVDPAAVFDLIVFSYQGVRLCGTLMPVREENARHITALITDILLEHNCDR